jgi:superfamily II DNA or RNA helicase
MTNIFLVSCLSSFSFLFSAKSLVFSQFTSTLQWLKEELPNHGFQFRTLSGDMTMKKRAKALSDFQNDPPTTIFLLSMRAGAVGINLTQANRIFLMEPCFNPSLEAQAIGRVHRLGQKRSVEIIRLLISDSVDSRMVEMLEKKHGKTDGSEVNDKTDADAENKKDGTETTAYASKSDTGTDDDGDGDGEKDASDGDKKPAAVDKKGAALNAATEVAVQEVMVGSLYRDKATVVVEEFDLLYGVEPTDTDTVMQQEDEDRGDDLALDEMHAAGDHGVEDDLNGDHADQSDWI